MAQSANMTLVNNLKPFIARSINGTNPIFSNVLVSGGISAGDVTRSPGIGQLILQKSSASSVVQVILSDPSYTFGLTQGLANATSYLEIRSASTVSGGALYESGSSADYAHWFIGSANTENNGYAGVSTRGPFIFDGRIDNGDIPWNMNIATFKNNADSVVVIRGNGAIINHGYIKCIDGGLSGGTLTTATSGQLLLDQASLTGTSIRVQSDVTGMTTPGMEDNRAYFEVRRTNYQGGAFIAGASTSTHGIWIVGRATTGTSVTSSAAYAPAIITSRVAGGAVGSGNNVLTIRNYITTVVIVKDTGAVWSKNNSFTGPFDDEDDLALLKGYSMSKLNPVKKNWNAFITENMDRLEELNLIENDFVNVNGMVELSIGAIGQLNDRVIKLETMSFSTILKLLLMKFLRRK